MVEGGQPVPRLDWPVVTKERPLAVFVGSDEQTGRGNAPVGDSHPARFARTGGGIEADGEAVIAVIEGQRLQGLGHGANDHAAVRGRGLGLNEVQGESGNPVVDHAEGHDGFSLDDVAVVAQGQAEGVVDDIDAGLPRVGVGHRGNDAGDANAQGRDHLRECALHAA